MTEPLDEKGWEATMRRIRDYTMDAEAKKWWLRFCEAQQDLHAAEARIKALEEALRPFAKRHDEAVRPDDSDRDGVTVKTEHLRAARSALKENAL